jgi:hypothetical protein
MGNRMNVRLRNTIEKLGIEPCVPQVQELRRLSNPATWLLKQRGARWLLGKIYSTTFKLVTISDGK